jgi:hypothetical protein
MLGRKKFVPAGMFLRASLKEFHRFKLLTNPDVVFCLQEYANEAREDPLGIRR